MRYLADLLTLTRLILAIVLLVLAFTGGSPEAAFIIFIVAELTDSVDGTCAMKWPFPKDKTPKYRKYAAKFDMFADGVLTAAIILFLMLRVNWIIGAVVAAYFIIVSSIIEFVVYGKIMGHPNDCTKNSLIRRNFPLAKKIVLIRRTIYEACLVVIALIILFATKWPDAVKYGIMIAYGGAMVFIWFFEGQRRKYISRDAVDVEEKLATSAKQNHKN